MALTKQDKLDIAEIVQMAVRSEGVVEALEARPGYGKIIDVRKLGLLDAASLLSEIREVLGPVADQCCNGCD